MSKIANRKGITMNDMKNKLKKVAKNPKVQKPAKAKKTKTAGAKAVKFKSASTKVSSVAIAGFFVAVVVMMVSIMITVAGSATNLTNQIFFNLGEGNANYVGDILGAADDTASLLQSYLTM